MATRSRPAQGDNSRPGKPAAPAYAVDIAPSVVSRGSVSLPKPLPKWKPITQVPDRAPRVVQD